jgi:hypothetical protein
VRLPIDIPWAWRRNRTVFAPSWGKLLVSEDKILTEWRLELYGLGVIFAYAVALACRAFEHQWIVLPNGDIQGLDFGWMWLSGKLAASGEAARVFNPTAFSAAQQALFLPSLGPESVVYFNRFYYPPTFLFFTLPVGSLPYMIGCAAWITASLALYQAAVYAIIPRRAALIAAATPFFVAANILLVHTGFLTAAFMGLALAFMERRPWVSGIFLGLLTYKPQLGLLFPVALLASRNWRAFGSATATTVILIIASSIAFGYAGWVSFVDALGDRSPSLGPGANGEVVLYSIFGLLHWVGATAWMAWSGQLVVSAAVVLGIWVLWAKPLPYNLKAAILCAGSIMVSPYVMIYDLCILSIAATFLVAEGLSCGFLPGERTAILLCWTTLIPLHRPVGIIVCCVLIILCIRRIIAQSDHLAGLREASVQSTGAMGVGA